MNFSIAVPLFVLAIVFGVYPKLLLTYMDRTVDTQVEQLATWSEAYVRSMPVESARAAEAVTQSARPAATGPPANVSDIPPASIVETRMAVQTPRKTAPGT